MLGGSQEGSILEAGLVVRTNRGSDDKEQDFTGRGHAETGCSTDHGWAQIEGMAGLLWDPVFVQVDKLFDELSEDVAIKVRERKSGRRPLHALHVLVRSEQSGLAVLANVGLHAFKERGSIVENVGRGIKLEGSIRADLWLFPSVRRGPANRQHVVCELLAEDQILGCRLDARCVGVSHLETFELSPNVSLPHRLPGVLHQKFQQAFERTSRFSL